MLRLIIYCLGLGALSLCVNWLLNNDGMVAIDWIGYRIETSVSFLIIAATIGLVIGILLLQLFIWLFTLPTRITYRRNVINLNRGMSFLTEGFAAIAAGDTKSAKQFVKKTKRYLGNTQPLALILEAQAAQNEGDSELAARNYSTLLENKTTRIIGLKGLLGEARKTGNNARAINLAEDAFNKGQETKSMIPILLELYKREGQWNKALAILEQAYSWKGIPLFGHKQFNIKREKAILNYMAARNLFDEGKMERALELVKKARKLYPGFIPSTILLAKVALRMEKPQLAANAIKKAWKTLPTQHLGELYLHIYDADPRKQIKAVSKLSLNNPNHVESHLLLASAALNAGDLALAREQLRIALVPGDTARACEMMAKLEELGGANEATIEEWRERALGAKPDPGWYCRSCSCETDEWNLICQQCGSMDSYEFGHAKLYNVVALRDGKQAASS